MSKPFKDEHPGARNAVMFSIGQFGPDATIAVPLVEAAMDAKNQQSTEAVRNIDRLLNFIGGQAQGGVGSKECGSSISEPQAVTFAGWL